MYREILKSTATNKAPVSNWVADTQKVPEGPKGRREAEDTVLL